MRPVRVMLEPVGVLVLPGSIGTRDSARLEDKQCREGEVEATSTIRLFPVILITGNRLNCVFIDDSLVSVDSYAKI